MKKIGVIVNTKRKRAEQVLGELRAVSAELGFSLFAENGEIAETLGAESLPVEAFGETVDAALAMGGDGTVLYTARALHGTGIPILGINLGSLGFLTSVSDREIGAALKTLNEGSFKVSERDVADCRIFQSGGLVGEKPALNDVVLGWGASSRIVTLNLSIDSEPVSSFMCDGMIVSTPTGSTGHALSSGGPILHPLMPGFGINVICPHTLSSRPIVVPNSCLIEIEVANAAKELIVSIDGQDEFTVKKGAKLEIRRSPHRVKFLQPADHSYFSVLAQKLHWRGSAI